MTLSAVPESIFGAALPVTCVGTREEVIMEVCGKYNYPVCFDFPAGHGGQNYALPLGRTAKLSIGTDNCSILFEK